MKDVYYYLKYIYISHKIKYTNEKIKLILISSFYFYTINNRVSLIHIIITSNLLICMFPLRFLRFK